MGKHEISDGDQDVPNEMQASATSLVGDSIQEIRDKLAGVRNSSDDGEDEAERLYLGKKLLVDQDPKKSRELIEALISSPEADERGEAVSMILKLFRHDFHAAMEYLVQVSEDKSIDVHGDIPELVVEAVDAGDLDIADAKYVVGNLCQRMGENARRIQELEAENAALREDNRVLGRAATRGADVHIGRTTGSIILGDGTRIIQIDDNNPEA